MLALQVSNQQGVSGPQGHKILCFCLRSTSFYLLVIVHNVQQCCTSLLSQSTCVRAFYRRTTWPLCHFFRHCFGCAQFRTQHNFQNITLIPIRHICLGVFGHAEHVHAEHVPALKKGRRGWERVRYWTVVSLGDNCDQGTIVTRIGTRVCIIM